MLFCLAWIIPTWLVFEAVPTKLFHYVLPVYAALALLAARAVLDGFGKARPWLTGGAAVLFAVIALALTGGMAALPIAVEKRFDPLSILLALVTLAVLAFGIVLFRRGWLRRSVAALTVGALGLYLLGVPGGVPPVGNHLAQPAHRCRRSIVSGPVPIACSSRRGLPKPASSFWSGTDTVLTGNGAAAAKVLAEDSCALALVDQNQNRSFSDQAALDGIHPTVTETISGFN